jgi:hypothetical protein
MMVTTNWVVRRESLLILFVKFIVGKTRFF